MYGRHSVRQVVSGDFDAVNSVAETSCGIEDHMRARLRVSYVARGSMQRAGPGDRRRERELRSAVLCVIDFPQCADRCATRVHRVAVAGECNRAESEILVVIGVDLDLVARDAEGLRVYAQQTWLHRA